MVKNIRDWRRRGKTQDVTKDRRVSYYREGNRFKYYPPKLLAPIFSDHEIDIIGVDLDGDGT
jgi:hypothetical protein